MYHKSSVSPSSSSLGEKKGNVVVIQEWIWPFRRRFSRPFFLFKKCPKWQINSTKTFRLNLQYYFRFVQRMDANPQRMHPVLNIPYNKEFPTSSHKEPRSMLGAARLLKSILIITKALFLLCWILEMWSLFLQISTSVQRTFHLNLDSPELAFEHI